MADVYLHVGLAKTGTTTIQAALDATADRLVAEGVLFPDGHHAQRLAAYDLLGQRVRGAERGEVAGSLRRLLDTISSYDGPTVVVSEEELSMAGPRQARRLVRGLVECAGRPLDLPPQHHGFTRSYAEGLVAELETRGLEMHGDLRDLVPVLTSTDGPTFEEIDDAELLAATQAALVSMALDHGRLFGRYRRAFSDRHGRLPGVAEVIGSQARAGTFWLGKQLVHRGSANQLVARASRAYLRRASPRSRRTHR